MDPNNKDDNGHCVTVLMKDCCQLVEHDLWPLLRTLEVQGDDVLIRIIRALVKDPMAVNSKQLTATPLLYVCRVIHGRLTLDLVRLLIDHGANVNSKDNNGWNALHNLCRYYPFPHNFQKLVRILLDSGIDVNAITLDGFNALHLLLLHQHGQHLIGVIRLLLERNININAKTRKGFTALHLLFRKCPMDDVMTVVNMFLDYQVQVLATNRDSWTALHFLCRFYTNDDLLDIVRLLVANISGGRNQLLKLKNRDGQCPLELCILNPSGHFHSVFKYVRKDNHLFGQFFKFSPESLMDLANYGCLHVVSWFLKNHQHIKTSNIRDRQGRSWFDYLHHVLWISLSLCHKCSQLDFYTMTSLLADCSFTENNKSSPSLSFSSYTKQLEHRRISARSLENLSILYPANSHLWNTLVQLWNKTDAEGWTEFGPAINKYALDHSHSAERCNANPAVCIWCRVSEDVQNYIQFLIDQCEILDPRLTHTELIGYGSAFEKTNLFRPEEYDFAVVLKHFNELRADDNWVDVVYGGPDNLNVDIFTRRNPKNVCWTISSERLFYHYGLVMEKVIRHAHWNPKIFNPKVTISKSSCLTLIFHYRTKGYDGHPISVDLTLAVLSKIKEKPNWCPIQNLPQYIVPNRRHSPGLTKLNDWKLSSFVLERDTLLHHEFGETFLHIFRILKILVCLNQAQPGERKFSRRMNIISTYDIKIELLEYARTHPPPWELNDMIIITHCCGVLNCLILRKQLKQYYRRRSNLDYVYPYAHGFTCVKYIEEIIKRLKRWNFVTPQI